MSISLGIALFVTFVIIIILGYKLYEINSYNSGSDWNFAGNLLIGGIYILIALFALSVNWLIYFIIN